MAQATPDQKPAWFKKNLTELKPEARQLFESYSNVPSDQVKSHIEQFRNKAFEVYPYPCLGAFSFLDLSISMSPCYSEILERVKSGDIYLDLGCCVGQDIRKLVYDGAPSENTYGSDLSKEFMDIGYELFLDKPTLKTTFIAADALNPDSDLKQLNGKIDIINTASFFHLFEWDDQVKVAKMVVNLLKPKPGGMLVGRQIGNVDPGHVPSSNSEKQRFRQNPESWAKLWKQVGDETGTSWEVHAKLDDEDLVKKAEQAGLKVNFIPPGSRWLGFTVRRT
ncbi:hypothetical protein CC78DRAFT_453044 [Lojkania enalia]|uniref:Methyltransferase domain-containing protein n=1 Tax=Lojkania enalia TaxID=147567 RepID=A0A9P4NAX3_9PLEO|nr:hypothetical protein CC78DRAFT_453044 [Didymosphaeria enalia]